MESIYWVLCWACHRKCAHCYEDRFRPYVRGDLERVIAEAEANVPRIVRNLPDSMIHDDAGTARVGRIILAGGEVLLEGVRQRVTYPAIAALRARYADAGGVKIIVQTTGDVLTPEILADLLALGVWMISIASLDDYHVGLDTPEKRARFRAGLTAMFQAHGMTEADQVDRHAHPGALFGFFGATPGSWIGALWPRGRAWSNGLTKAGMEDDFCARWSGGVNFLNHGKAGSEVSVDPNGDVFPCCLKTRLPIGNLTEEKLIPMLDSLRADPVYAAINAGMPERMGLADGWDQARFMQESSRTTPKGQTITNKCLGCDAFHEKVLAPRIAAARAARRVAA